MFWCFLFFCPHVGSVKNTPLFSWAVGYGLVDFWAVFFLIIIICRLTVKLDHISKRKEPLYSDGECSFLLFTDCYRTKCHSGATLKQQFLERVSASTINPLGVK